MLVHTAIQLILLRQPYRINNKLVFRKLSIPALLEIKTRPKATALKPMLTESGSNSLFNFQLNPVFEQNVHYIQPSLSHSHEVIVVRTKFKKL